MYGSWARVAVGAAVLVAGASGGEGGGALVLLLANPHLISPPASSAAGACGGGAFAHTVDVQGTLAASMAAVVEFKRVSASFFLVVFA